MNVITEDQIIIRCTNQCFSETDWNVDKFAAELLFPALLAQEGKEPEYANGDDYLRWRARTSRQFLRVIRGSTNFPLRWKWAWVGCLPEPYRRQCRQELLSLAGTLDVPLPVFEIGKPEPARARMAEFMRESADVLAAAAPADDGVYDQSDDPEAVDRLADEIVDVIEFLERELLAIGRGTGRTGKRRRTVVEASIRIRSEIDG